MESSGSVTHTDAKYLPITNISTLCLNGTDHVCPYIRTFVGLLKESSIHCTTNVGLVPKFPSFSKHSTECFKGAIKCLSCMHAKGVKYSVVSLSTKYHSTCVSCKRNKSVKFDKKTGIEW